MALKATGFVIFEFDNNEEILITFIYPSADKDLKTVIIDTATFLINSNQSSVYTAFGSKYLYFQIKRNANRSSDIRSFGICILADNLYPAFYAEMGQVLIEAFHDHGNAPRVLRQYLSSLTDGQLDYNGFQFSIENFDEDVFQKLNYSPLIDRISVNNLPMIWQALVTGKSVGVYSSDLTILQQCAIPILSFCCPGTRPLLPLVLESSSTMTDAADNAKNPIWCSIDSSVLSSRFDLTINLTAKTVNPSPAFQKELTSDMLEHLAESISEAVSATTSVYESIVEFNHQIVTPLQKVQEKLGDLSPASISSLKLPNETKALLSGIAQAEIIPI